MIKFENMSHLAPLLNSSRSLLKVCHFFLHFKFSLQQLVSKCDSLLDILYWHQLLLHILRQVQLHVVTAVHLGLEQPERLIPGLHLLRSGDGPGGGPRGQYGQLVGLPVPKSRRGGDRVLEEGLVAELLVGDVRDVGHNQEMLPPSQLLYS